MPRVLDHPHLHPRRGVTAVRARPHLKIAADLDAARRRTADVMRGVTDCRARVAAPRVLDPEREADSWKVLDLAGRIGIGVLGPGERPVAGGRRLLTGAADIGRRGRCGWRGRGTDP